jgi:hypothetical protein
MLNAQAMLELGDWINEHRSEVEQDAASPRGQQATAAVRERLQKKGTRSATRRLVAISGRITVSDKCIFRTFPEQF